MIQSLNSKVDFVVDATYYNTFHSYGKIMIGNESFEFYNNFNPKKCIQIKWENIDKIIATVKFKGKWIPRFSIITKDNNVYYFSCKQPLQLLKIMRNYIDSEKMTRSLTIFDSIKRKFK
nr:DUF956 family protein [uncultured Tyzzerella sp.]